MLQEEEEEELKHEEEEEEEEPLKAKVEQLKRNEPRASKGRDETNMNKCRECQTCSCVCRDRA